MDRQSKHKHENIGEYSNFSSNYCNIDKHPINNLYCIKCEVKNKKLAEHCFMFI